MHVNIWRGAEKGKRSVGGGKIRLDAGETGGRAKSPRSPSHSELGAFTRPRSVYLRHERAESLIEFCCPAAAVPTLPVAVPGVRSGLPTSGSDESNWKHVLHARSPDRWDNIMLLMTERERRGEGERETWEGKRACRS